MKPPLLNFNIFLSPEQQFRIPKKLLAKKGKKEENPLLCERKTHRKLLQLVFDCSQHFQHPDLSLTEKVLSSNPSRPDLNGSPSHCSSIHFCLLSLILLFSCSGFIISLLLFSHPIVLKFSHALNNSDLKFKKSKVLFCSKHLFLLSQSIIASSSLSSE